MIICHPRNRERLSAGRSMRDTFLAGKTTADGDTGGKTLWEAESN